MFYLHHICIICWTFLVQQLSTGNFIIQQATWQLMIRNNATINDNAFHI